MSVVPIGFMRTCFETKNGTPRQPTVSPLTRGFLVIAKSIFTNPEHSLDGLEEFSHVWVIFQFHLNENKSIKAKVKPPRLDGIKKGVFATRSPHRPNAIGLTLAKLEKIEGCTLHLSGLDIVDGTPVIDVKPYISLYDSPVLQEERCSDLGATHDHCSGTGSTSMNLKAQQNEDVYVQKQLTGNIVTPQPGICWVTDAGLPVIKVLFTQRAEEDLQKFRGAKSTSPETEYRLNHLDDSGCLRQSIVDILAADPRSTYRRNKCSDRLYYFSIDGCHITSWFDYSTSPVTVEVLRVKPENLISHTLDNTTVG